MYIGTIHAYCFHLLQDHVPRYGNNDILDENRLAGLLSREFRSLGLAKLGARHWQPIRDFAKPVDVMSNELIRPEQLDGTPLGECVRAYYAMLDRYHFLTYGSLITSAVNALETPAIFQRVHGPLRHLLVDEYQDINPAQERLYSDETGATGRRITLKPANPAFAPIFVGASDEGHVRVLAEVVEVLPSANA
jgi:DNA helicase II / ATP-dependent DNA helicase PcrA